MEMSIEQQVAALTDEQKANMGRIYKRYVTTLLSIVAAVVIVAVAVFVCITLKIDEVQNKREALAISMQLDPLNSLSLFDESSALLDQYYDLQQWKSYVLILAGVTALMAVLIVFVIFKKKYPYFSEKKYTYLKKMNALPRA